MTILQQVKSQLKQGDTLNGVRITLFRQLDSIVPKVKINKLIAVGNLLYINSMEPMLHWNVDALFEFCRAQTTKKVLMSTPIDWLMQQSETSKFNAFELISRQETKNKRLKAMRDLGCLDETVTDVLVSRRLELPQEVWSEIVGMIVSNTKIRAKRDTSFYSKGIKELLYQAYK